jgi:Zn-dependent protease with chaperone function
MAGRASLYPPSPADVPPDLTAPRADYRLRVVVVLVSLFVFFVLYLGLVFGSAWLTWWALTAPWPRGGRGDGVGFLRILVIVLAPLLFLFLLKGFFKRQRRQKGLDIEIYEEEHPKLFAFLDRLCDETGAPFPHRVFVSPDVNAAVFYNNPALSLFWPVPKNLLIGLGLVNALSLTEFKAVLAHEFGHFSQKSMKLGSYAYTAMRIMADIVYGRDRLDDWLDRVCHADGRVAVFGWAFKGVLWVLRKALAGMFHAVNFLHAALSREMEFHADLVAVSVTGSDTTAHVLLRARFAEEALDQACRDLRDAADHHLYTNDLFVHQTRAMAYLRQARKDPTLGEPPTLPADAGEVPYLFEPGEEGIPSMWASHPTNYERERNAKRCYIPTEFDPRPAWLLFDRAEKLREQVTWRFYRVAMRVPREVAVADAADVQAFIDEEHAETTYDPRYHGLYDGRLLDTGDVDELVRSAAAEPWDDARLRRAHSLLYGEELAAWMKEHNRRLEEYNLLQGLCQGRLKLTGGDLDFRGRFYEPAEAERLLKKVDAELTEDDRWLATLDRKVFLIHYQTAPRAGEPAAARELAERYRFHVAVQRLLRGLMRHEGAVGATVQFLSSRRQLEPEHFREALAVFREAHQALTDVLRDARDLALPPLKNMTPGESLRPFLLAKRLVYELRPDEYQLPGTWIQKFLDQLGEVLGKLRRVHFKSLGGILSLQERIACRFLASAQEDVPQALSVVRPAPP